MKDQLIKYVDLLFAGVPGASDIKQEILQNTLDKYEDLISEGKTPQAAYTLAISGIGDIHEILNSSSMSDTAQNANFAPSQHEQAKHQAKPAWKKLLRAIAIFLYIISIIPLIVLSALGMEIIGLCGTVGIVAVATALIIMSSDSKDKDNDEDDQKTEENTTPQQKMRKSIRDGLNTAALVIFLILSFSTGAWYITWLIFPIMGAVQGLINACMDLKEANANEN